MRLRISFNFKSDMNPGNIATYGGRVIWLQKNIIDLLGIQH